MLGIKKAIRTALFEKYATFSGRASRSEYWWYLGFYFLLLSVFAVIIHFVTKSDETGGNGIDPLRFDTSSFIILIFIGISVPLVSVQVRRFHDRNLSGWWYLALAVLSLLPGLGFFFSITIFAMSTLRGIKGPNRFGPDPLHNEEAVAVFE